LIDSLAPCCRLSAHDDSSHTHSLENYTLIRSLVRDARVAAERAQDTTDDSSPTTSPSGDYDDSSAAPSDEQYDAMRARLQRFLRASDRYDVATVTRALGEWALWEERAALLAKSSDHSATLLILVFRLRDFAGALAYCAGRPHEPERRRAALQLLRMYLRPPDGSPPLLENAMTLLTAHSQLIDPLQVRAHPALNPFLGGESETASRSVADLPLAEAHAYRERVRGVTGAGDPVGGDATGAGGGPADGAAARADTRAAADAGAARTAADAVPGALRAGVHSALAVLRLVAGNWRTGHAPFLTEQLNGTVHCARG
jgi:hypothetical protein